jgi:hypothetical protein
MNLCNIVLLIIGLFTFFMGIIWGRKNWFNVIIKIIFILSSFYLVWYSLYLSNILIMVRG